MYICAAKGRSNIGKANAVLAQPLGSHRCIVYMFTLVSVLLNTVLNTTCNA